MPRDDGRLQVRLDRSLWDWLEYRAERVGTASADLQARRELEMALDADHAYHARRFARPRTAEQQHEEEPAP